MATVNLGRIKPVFRGAYSGSTAYVVDDIVTSGNETYICIQAHGAGTQAVSQTAYWTKLAAKGADGTDVGATLTTQGDILYRDGSGLQRLPKGTASQQLAMNAGATAPEWINASSDYVKLASQTITSNTASITFKGFANAIYSSYELVCTDVQKSGSNDASFKFRWHINNSDVTSGNYRSTFMGHHFNSSNSNNENYGGNWNSDNIQIANWNMSDTRNSGVWVNQMIINIGNLSDNSFRPTMTYTRLNPHPSATYTNFDTGGGYHNGSESQIAFGTNDGFSLIPDADQWGKGIFVLYGRKK